MNRGPVEESDRLVAPSPAAHSPTAYLRCRYSVGRPSPEFCRLLGSVYIQLLARGVERGLALGPVEVLGHETNDPLDCAAAPLRFRQSPTLHLSLDAIIGRFHLVDSEIRGIVYIGMTGFSATWQPAWNRDGCVGTCRSCKAGSTRCWRPVVGGGLRSCNFARGFSPPD